MTLMAMLLAFAMFLAITPNVFAAATAATLSYASSDVLPVLANDLLSMRFDLCSKSVGGGTPLMLYIASKAMSVTTSKKL